jgi:hypothetical protein
VEVCEFFCVESFREYMGNVVMCVDVVGNNFLGLNTLTEEMMFNVNVFDAVVEHWIFRKVYCCVIVRGTYHLYDKPQAVAGTVICFLPSVL